MRKIYCLFLLLAVLLSGCGEKQNISPSPVVHVLTPADMDAEAPPETEKPAPEDTAREALAVAELYRDIFEDAFVPNDMAWSLDSESVSEIVNRLGDEGLTAVSSGDDGFRRNTAAVRGFLEDAKNGTEAVVSVYEIYSDGGFLCHTLAFADGGYLVTRTRLAWRAEGVYQLSGTTPTVTYSNTYAVTDISAMNGVLHYEYDMPDNPPGKNHDGHIDTIADLFIGE